MVTSIIAQFKPFVNKPLLKSRMEGDSMSFGENLKRERERKGISQEELAKHIGITQAAISQYENEITSPTVALAVRIASFFGKTCEDMVR